MGVMVRAGGLGWLLAQIAAGLKSRATHEKYAEAHYDAESWPD